MHPYLPIPTDIPFYSDNANILDNLDIIFLIIQVNNLVMTLYLSLYSTIDR